MPERANNRNLALSLIAAYVMARSDVSKKEIGEHVTTSPKLTYDRLGEYLKGTLNLNDAQFGQLHKALYRRISQDIDEATLALDMGFLLPLFDEVRAYPSVKLEVDPKQGDASFLRALNLSVGSLPADKGNAIYDKIGGFWFVIRFSTAGEARDGVRDHATPNEQRLFNVSLLTVHDTAYVDTTAMTSPNDEPREVATIVPHFTLRSRPKSDVERVYRGRVIELGSELHFLGTRDDHDKLIRMSWGRPTDRKIENQLFKKVRESRGIMTTASSSGSTITGPIAVCEIPHNKEMLEAKKKCAGEEATSKDVANLFLARRKELEVNVSGFTDSDLLSTLGKFCGTPTLVAALRALRDARNEVGQELKGGNYYVKSD